jgi:hypothetical protein
MELLTMQFLQPPVTSSLLGPNIGNRKTNDSLPCRSKPFWNLVSSQLFHDCNFGLLPSFTNI